VKKEVRTKVETSEKLWGYVAGEGEFENRDKSPWDPKKGPKKCENFWKGKGNVSSGGSIFHQGLNPLKKEVSKKVETTEKIWGYVAGEEEFENSGQQRLGPPKRFQKFLNKLF